MSRQFLCALITVPMKMISLLRNMIQYLSKIYYIYLQFRDSINLLGSLHSTDYPRDDKMACMAFAPDESRLAWSPDRDTLVIVPWNRYKNCLLSMNNYDEEGEQLHQDQCTIDCVYPITCISFGTGEPESEYSPDTTKCFWQRLDRTDHLLVVTGHTNGRIRVWNPYNGRLVLELYDHTKAVTSVSFAPNGSLRVASASTDGTLKLWDLADDGNMYRTLKGHKAPINQVAWSPDSQIICSVGHNRKAMLWDAKSCAIIFNLKGHQNDVLSCAFSPDGATVATASADTTTMVWNTTTGDALRTLYHVTPLPGIIYMSGLNNSFVKSVSFSPDGCTLATICADGGVRYWDLSGCNDSTEPAIKAPEGDSMLECSFTPFGATLAVGFKSGNVMFYSTPSTVPSLLHLSRMSIRKSFGDVTDNTVFTLPNTLKPYLQYKQW